MIGGEKMDRGMTLLVTGGAGFIGSNFVRYMLEQYPDYRIINLDKLTYAGNLENLRTIEDNPNYKFIKGDIINRELVEYIFAEYGVNYVINFAAESHVDRSIEEPDIFIKTNIMGTQVLLDIAKKYWLDKSEIQNERLRATKFIQISTDEVYGSLGEEGNFTEDTPLAPNSPYSSSKTGADLVARAYYKTFGLPVNITRCSNNYGPYQFPEKLIPFFLTNALYDKELPLYGDGKNVRDWLHVKDHCRAIDLVLHEASSGELYNIGGNNEMTNLKITEIILQELDKPTSLIKLVEDRLGHDRRYAIDASKIKSELGWEPRYTFNEGIKATIKWYLDNKEWWQPLRIS